MVYEIFVSRPTWVDPEYSPGLEAFLNRLRDSGLSPRTLGATDYPVSAPLDEVVEIISQCHGAVVLGYPQLRITDGYLKGDRLGSELVLGTEWNHIEAGLAYARKLPLLIIHQMGVTRGIFDRGVLRGFLYECDFANPAWCQSDPISGALVKWRSLVASYRPVRMTTQPLPVAPVGSALCPNCSTPDRAFYMTKLEPEFQEITGSTHTCSRCNSNFTPG